MKIQLGHTYEEIISIENLCAAWGEFLNGKRGKPDVQEFGRRLADNIVQLHNDLADGSYAHGGYYEFCIADPKPRTIHKASVRDRLLHHAVYRILYPFFDRTFTTDSYSCRDNKGTHRALSQFKAYANKVSRNHHRTCWILKCDIRKFFANIDHARLIHILRSHIPDGRIMGLLEHIIKSFETSVGVGLPLGNLTSQLFTNVYMNVFDQFVKHKLKSRFYIRYADDFVVLSHNRAALEAQLTLMNNFLQSELGLVIHPDKIYLQTIASGVDFLGWSNFPKHRVLRRATKQRMFRRILVQGVEGRLQSYRGLLRHGNTLKVQRELMNLDWLLSEKN